MDPYQALLLPCLLHVNIQNGELTRIRERLIPLVRGRVLEGRCGSGLDPRFYTTGVEELWAIDSNPGLMSMAYRRANDLPPSVEFFEHKAESVPMDDRSFDTLTTIEDVIEEVVGEIEDGHDVDPGPKMLLRPDKTSIADARTRIEEFEQRVGPVLLDEEREQDIETLDGLVFALTGRVPARGETITHPSGLVFEALDADPRRVTRLRVRNLPSPPDHE